MTDTSEEKPVTVGRLIQEFLQAKKIHAAPATYRWYEQYLRSFRIYAGEQEAASLRNSVVYSWLGKCYSDKSANTQHAAARTVVAMLNWSAEERLLSESPLRRFQKPAPESREASVTSAQYALCLRTVKAGQRADKAGAALDVIKFLWHTGCRPQELRSVEAQFIDDNKITLPLALSKGKKKRRVIYLNDMARRIVARLAEQYPEGQIFRNTRGKPWTKNSLVLIFRRLREKTGIEGLCPYAFRHAFITRMLEKGVDVATVAAIAGNSPRMVLNNYNHVAQDEERLARLVA